jgi:hypothetical protein
MHCKVFRRNQNVRPIFFVSLYLGIPAFFYRLTVTDYCFERFFNAK